MVGTGNSRPNAERRVDPEGGAVPTAADLKAAAEVAAAILTEAEYARLQSEIADRTRDADTSLTRARRDRDRATPRDQSAEPSSRLQQDLPAPQEYREPLSQNQRKIRSRTKNQVMAAAPETQTRALETLIGTDDPTRRRSIQAQLHAADGDVQKLSKQDRELVQRVDRAIASYERANDRSHRVYIAMRLPSDMGSVVSVNDLPANLRPGERISFDQFTFAKHDPGELPGHDDDQHVIFEMVTTRGAYLGRSNSIVDTTHLLPRGMDLEVVGAKAAPFHGADGKLHDRLIVQVRERRRAFDDIAPSTSAGTRPQDGPRSEGEQ